MGGSGQSAATAASVGGSVAATSASVASVGATGTVGDADGAQAASSAKLLSLILMVVAGIAGFSIAFLVANAIVKGVRRVLSAADRIAEGDLEHEIDVTNRDEVGDPAWLSITEVRAFATALGVDVVEV